MSFDTKLATIRGFNGYLNRIISRGHLNHYSTIDSLYSLIKKYYEDRVDPLSNVFDSEAYLNDENKNISTYDDLVENDAIMNASDSNDEVTLLSESQSEPESEPESDSDNELMQLYNIYRPSKKNQEEDIAEKEIKKYEDFKYHSDKIDTMNIYKMDESHINRLETYMTHMWEY